MKNFFKLHRKKQSTNRQMSKGYGHAIHTVIDMEVTNSSEVLFHTISLYFVSRTLAL